MSIQEMKYAPAYDPRKQEAFDKASVENEKRHQAAQLEEIISDWRYGTLIDPDMPSGGQLLSINDFENLKSELRKFLEKHNREDLVDMASNGVDKLKAQYDDGDDDEDADGDLDYFPGNMQVDDFKKEILEAYRNS